MATAEAAVRVRPGGASLAAVLGLLVAASPAVAEATNLRLGIYVANHRADEARARLRYAGRDARRLQQVMKRLGGVQEAVLLIDAPANDLRKALARMARRVRQVDGEVTLVFYYSGHADHLALLMGQTRFPFTELRGLLKRFPAKIAISFLDACHSGGITQLKGGRMVPVVDARFDDQAHRGRVTITSSSDGEKSQESDDLQASVFTHYLLSALQGAADDSGDGKVTLQEAYRFAYNHTLSRTSRTLHGPQHPSYRVDLAGAGQVALTYLRPRGSFLSLAEGTLGRFFVYEQPGGLLVAEVTKQRRRRLKLALSPGVYEVRRQGKDHQLSATVHVQRGVDSALTEAAMVRVASSEPQTKGGEVPGGPPGLLRLNYELHSGYLDQAPLMNGVGLGYAHAVGPVELGGTLIYHRSSYDRSDGLQVDLDELLLLLAIEWRPLRWWRLGLVTGLDLGGGWVWQEGTAASGIQKQSRPLFRYRGRVGIELSLGWGLVIGAAGHVGQVVTETTGGVEAPLVGGLEAGVGIRL